MRGNRFITSQKLAGLALTPVVLTLVLAKGASLVSLVPTPPQDSARLADFGSVGKGAIVPIRFALSTVFIAEAPAARPAGAILETSKTAPPDALIDTVAADPAAPASEFAAHPPVVRPRPVETVPVQTVAVQTVLADPQGAPGAANPQPVLSEQANLQPVVPVAVAAYPSEAADDALLAAKPAEVIPAPVPDLPGSSAAEQPSSLAQTQPQSVPIIQPTPVQTVVIADWKYALPSEVRAASVQSFAGQAESDAGVAPAKPAAPPSRALSNGRTVHRTPAQLAMAQNGTAAGAKGTRRGPGIAAPVQPHGKYRMAGNAIEFQLPVEVNGEQLGNVTLHVLPDQQIALQLHELVTLFAPQLDRQLLEALSGTQTAEQYVSFDKLRKAGIDIRYDGARDQIRLTVAQP